MLALDKLPALAGKGTAVEPRWDWIVEGEIGTTTTKLAPKVKYLIYDIWLFGNSRGSYPLDL